MNQRIPSLVNWHEVIELRWRSDWWVREAEDIGEHWDEQLAVFGRPPLVPPKKSLHAAVMAVLPLDAADTVLDVASGPGRLTLPLSTRVKSVTAFDGSKPLLDALRTRLQEEKITNVTTAHHRFLDENVPNQVPLHDRVIACQCLGVISADRQKRVRQDLALERLNNLATKSVHIILPHMFASLDRDFLQHFPHNQQLPVWTGEMTAFQLAHSLGYMPRMDYLPCQYEETFDDFEEMTEEIREMMELPPEYQEMVTNWLNSKITKTAEGYHLKLPALVQHIWWLKNQNWLTGLSS
jgi:SAM-dependent methyltransferase